jgi:hypothetical protein
MDKEHLRVTAKWADSILFGNFETTVNQGKKAASDLSRKGKAVDVTVRCSPQRMPAFDAKNRLGLPAEIEMGESPEEAWKNLVDAIKAARTPTTTEGAAPMPKYEVGRYEVKITGQGFQKASTGTLQFVLQFEVQGKVDPRDPQTLISVAPGERKWYKAITEKTVDWLMDDLKVLGVEGITSWAQLDPTIAPDDFIDLSDKLIDMMCGSKNGTDGKSYEDWSIAREGGGS